MRTVSSKRQGQLREYSKARKDYLAAKPICAVCGKRRAIEIHHRAGREGRLLLDQTEWLAVCRICHYKIHSEPKWARQYGYRK